MLAQDRPYGKWRWMSAFLTWGEHVTRLIGKRIFSPFVRYQPIVDWLCTSGDIIDCLIHQMANRIKPYGEELCHGSLTMRQILICHTANASLTMRQRTIHHAATVFAAWWIKLLNTHRMANVFLAVRQTYICHMANWFNARKVQKFASLVHRQPYISWHKYKIIMVEKKHFFILKPPKYILVDLNTTMLWEKKK